MLRRRHSSKFQAYRFVGLGSQPAEEQVGCVRCCDKPAQVASHSIEALPESEAHDVEERDVNGLRSAGAARSQAVTSPFLPPRWCAVDELAAARQPLGDDRGLELRSICRQRPKRGTRRLEASRALSLNRVAGSRIYWDNMQNV